MSWRRCFNDTHGHRMGDTILRTIARVLAHHARERDVPARYGGEEFAVILPETDGARAAAVADPLRAAVEGLRVEGLCVAISAGVSAWRAGLLADDFIHRTDRWPYEAKRRGRNRVCAAPFP